VDAGPWKAFGERRAQIYGYSYDYRKGGAYRLGDLPPWAQDVALRLQRDGLIAEVPDQLIANEYAPGQGIPAHVDAELFTDTIISISLGSTCVMEFADSSGRTEQQLLEPMSALIIAGESRSSWKHSIPGRTTDVWMGRELPRTRRVSLTFRKMLPLAQRPMWAPP
jgi:alkylated DNA repair dioxygenase AlkB